jgi:hypothetical protein
MPFFLRSWERPTTEPLEVTGRDKLKSFEAVEHAGLERKEIWINDAVTNFENRRCVSNVSRPLGHPLRTIVTVTAEGRKEAEFIRSRNPF